MRGAMARTSVHGSMRASTALSSVPTNGSRVQMKDKSFMCQVVVNEGEPPESALRRFRRAVMSAGVIPEVRRRRYFENTQDIKKRKDKELRKRRGRKPFKPQQSMASAMSSGRFSDTMPPAGLSAPFAELFTPDAEEEEGSDAK
eukprot:jgi/Pico_ML_1/54963/g95.t2